jgi:hypothetical protein
LLSWSVKSSPLWYFVCRFTLTLRRKTPFNQLIDDTTTHNHPNKYCN